MRAFSIVIIFAVAIFAQEAAEPIYPLVDAPLVHGFRETEYEPHLVISHKQNDWVRLQLQYLVDQLEQVLRDGDSKVHIGWLEKHHERTMNVTHLFHTLYSNVTRNGTHFHEYKIILVPGLYTSYYPGYFHKNVKYLKSRGYDVDILPVGDHSVEKSAAIIRNYLLSVSKPVILYAHSKGSVDASAALGMYPELRTRIRSFISIQAPYAGTAFANDLVSNNQTRKFMENVIRLVLRDSPDALLDLTYQKRKDFISRYPFCACSHCHNHACDSDCVFTLSFASSSESMLSLMYPVIQYIKLRYLQASDGLVTLRDAIIPNSAAIILNDLDHSVPAFEYFPNISAYDPGHFTEAMIHIAEQLKTDKSVTCSAMDISSLGKVITEQEMQHHKL